MRKPLSDLDALRILLIIQKDKHEQATKNNQLEKAKIIFKLIETLQEQEKQLLKEFNE